MSLTTEHQKETCLAIGAGAIGKSITGYIFSRLGFLVTFADIAESVVSDIRQRNGYEIYIAQTGKPDTQYSVRDVRAVQIQSPEAMQKALETDYICTAIGSAGLRTLVPTLTTWIKARNAAGGKQLYLLFFENDFYAQKIVSDALKLEIGAVPPWLKMVCTSIERMGRLLPHQNGGTDVLSEQFIPVIAEKQSLGNSSVGREVEYFQLVEDVGAYYYRKLFTNNLGHAVLGFAGTYAGYLNTIEAMEDNKIRNLLQRTLYESGEMLVRQYGFTWHHINRHLMELMQRFANVGLSDSLSRLCRDPIRKLGQKERLVGAINRCYECGIQPRAMLETLCYVIHYVNPLDAEAVELERLRMEKGVLSVITEVCGVKPDSRFFNDVKDTYLTFWANV